MELTTHDIFTDVANADGDHPHRVSRRPIDLVQLARHARRSGVHEREALEGFRIQSVICLKRLKDTAGNGTWQDAVRTIRGRAHCVGARRVAETAAAAARLDGNARPAHRARIVESLERHVDETNDFIRSLFDES